MASSKQPTVTILSPREALSTASKHVPKSEFQQLSFWGKLNNKDQQSLLSEGNQLASAMITHGSSGLAIGAHLRVVHTLLSPHRGAFLKFIRKFSFTERTAYRFMNMYEEAYALLPGHVIRAAMARGMNIPGGFTEAIHLLPPPRNLPEDGANRYLDQIIQTRKDIIKGRKEGTIPKEKIKRDEMQEARRQPEFLLMQSYRMAKNSMRVLTVRQRRRFLESLVGMLLTETGASSPQTFSPEAIPEEFRLGRGRPRLERSQSSADGDIQEETQTRVAVNGH